MEDLKLKELEKRYAELGGSLSHSSLKAKYSEAINLAMQEADFEMQKRSELEEKRPFLAKRAGEWAGAGLSIVSTLFTLVFVFAGLLLGTIFLIIAEYAAVYEGFSAITSIHAELYAFSLVLFYIVVLFVEQIVIDRFGQRQNPKFSFRLLARDIQYMLGGGDSWGIRYSEAPDEARKVKTTVTLLTWAIILFGLLGRLKEALLLYKSETWAEGLTKILTESSLQAMLGYLAMFIATAALLFANKWIIHFIYGQFRRVTGGVIVQDFSSASMVILSPTQRIEAAQAKVLEREILRLESGKKISD